MTRRGLLKFLGVAPVALPIAALAASQSAIIGIDGGGVHGFSAVAVSAADVGFIEARRFAIEQVCRGFMSINEARALEGLPPCI